MSRELLLLRHGKSDWNTDTDDFSRPLKPRGVKAATRIGTWLCEQRLVPDLVLSSTALRAISTASACCTALGVADNVIKSDDRLYLADPVVLIEVLAALPADCSRVILVGHNPGLEILLVRLIGGFPPVHPDGKVLPTGTLAHLTFPGQWSELGFGAFSLVDLVRGKELRGKELQGKELKGAV